MANSEATRFARLAAEPKAYFYEEGPRGRLAILDWARETVAVATTVAWAKKVVAALNAAEKQS